MKRLICVYLSLVLLLLLPLSINASSITNNVVSIGTISVEFASDSAFSANQKQMIAEYYANKPNLDSSATTYNLLCTLLGHKTTTETATIIQHCVSDTAPRCLRSIQEVTMCTRCETLVDTYTISEVYIFCCD